MRNTEEQIHLIKLLVKQVYPAYGFKEEVNKGGLLLYFYHRDQQSDFIIHKQRRDQQERCEAYHELLKQVIVSERKQDE